MEMGRGREGACRLSNRLSSQVNSLFESLLQAEGAAAGSPALTFEILENLYSGAYLALSSFQL